MSKQDRRVLLGRITAPHGIRGEVVIESYAGQPQDVAAYGPLENEDATRQFDVTVVRVTTKGVIARLKGVADRTEAETLKGLKLYVDRARLPAAEEGEFYHADLVGLRAHDRAGQPIGRIVAVQNYGAGDLLEVRLEGSPKTELIPFTEAFVPEVDVADGRAVINMPTSEPDEEGAT